MSLESLEGTAAALRETRGFIGDWSRHKTDLSAAAPQAGHPTMADAIEQFCREWDYGFNHVADDLEELARALEVAATAYRETDQAVADVSGGNG